MADQETAASTKRTTSRFSSTREGLWSYEEDIYNPANFASMISTWQEQKDRLARNPSARPGVRPLLRLYPTSETG